VKKSRPYSCYTLDAAQLLGVEIARARRERRLAAQELADRVGISRETLRRVEGGDPTVGLGIAFEAAAIVGVPLFQEDRSRLTADLAQARDRLALLPDRVRLPRHDVDDDF
jgi:transcriptional regulator with XRE-family HTH domain